VFAVFMGFVKRPSAEAARARSASFGKGVIVYTLVLLLKQVGGKVTGKYGDSSKVDGMTKGIHHVAKNSQNDQVPTTITVGT
jgi:hypothetical protein